MIDSGGGNMPGQCLVRQQQQRDTVCPPRYSDAEPAFAVPDPRKVGGETRD